MKLRDEDFIFAVNSETTTNDYLLEDFLKDKKVRVLNLSILFD